MLPRRNYRNPPLIEVVAEFSFNDDLPWDSLRIADFYRAIGGPASFPDRREPGGRSKKGGTGSPRPGARLWQFLSSGGDKVVQVGRHKLVLNQLPPYYGWERFREEAGRIIQAYRQEWQPDRVESASLNYIDMLAIPTASVILDEYFNLYPVFPAPLIERGAQAFRLECQFNGDDEGETLAVSIENRAQQAPPLDFRLQWHYLSACVGPASVAGMLAWLDKAHARTSEAFRSSLTPGCEKLFDPE